MDYSHCIDIKCSRFKKYLSPFGRNVLDVMVLQWKKEYDRTLKYHPASNGEYEYPSRTVHGSSWGDQRRVLTFNESNDSDNIACNNTIVMRTHDEELVPRDTLLVHSIHDASHHDTSNEHQLGVSTSVIETHNTVTEITDNVDQNFFNTANLLNIADSTFQGDFQFTVQPKDIVFGVNEKASGDIDFTEQIATQIDILKSREPEKSIEYDYIKWDHIIDDILPQEEPTFDQNEVIEENIEKANLFENEFSEEAACDQINVKKNKINIISSEIITPGTVLKKIKKRNAQTKISDAVPKKVKKTVPKASKKPVEINLRKQKYTKAVNTWLETVDSYNEVDEDTAVIPLQVEDKLIIENIENVKNKKLKISVEKDSKEKKNKVKVQAQLANKDGVMKFKTPNTKRVDNEVEAKHDQKVNTEIKRKEKKGKPKFVAPIKSQISQISETESDVQYEIITIRDNDVLDTLNIDTNEIVMVLTYSNGFCQLSSQYTDDSCDADGVMMNVKQTFYHLKHNEFTNTQEIRKLLMEMFSNKTLIMYEAKSLLIYLATHLDIEFNSLHQVQIIDVKIGVTLLHPDSPPDTFSELRRALCGGGGGGSEAGGAGLSACPLQRAARHVAALGECAPALLALLRDRNLSDVFHLIEMWLVPIIADMERRGVRVDLDKLRALESALLDKMNAVEAECYRAAGRAFQIHSTAQVRAILYDELQLDSKSNVKIRETIATGAKSTSETMLRSLMYAHPLPKLILEYRRLHKAHATFLAGVAHHVTPDGLVKPTWVQMAAVTGRIACSNPNLQAIPKAPFTLDMVAHPGGGEASAEEAVQFRRVYVPGAGCGAGEGRSLLAADFQQVECRVFAHLAGDVALQHALATPGDIFTVLAAKWLNKPPGCVSAEDRERTKRIVYASLYGAGARKLMDILDASYEQTLAIIASFNSTFPSLKSFGRSVVSRCARDGGVLATVCGRTRRFEHIASADFALRSHAERQAVNFIVQGSAADLCKCAMVECCRALSEARLDGRLLLQIHDELVFDLRDEHLPRAYDVIKLAMEGSGRRCGLDMTLPVAISCGPSWGDLRPYDPTLPTAGCE